MNGGRQGFEPVPARPGLGSAAAWARVVVVVALLAALSTVLVMPAVSSAAPAPVATIEIEGVINPVTLRLISIAIDRAQAERVQALIILLDTPGGLERSMRAIVQRMMNAEVPVIVYVAPTGARAASAGVFITMAAHVAAMAPATNIGAASPVAMGGNADKTMMKKVENDAAAFIRTVATERGRNADWAEKAVREAVAIMREHHVGCVLVVEGERLAGILTERDLLLKMEHADLDGPVSRLMTPDPETLSPDDPIVYALNKMSVGGFRHVPLVDGDGRPVGVVSVKDVVDYIVDFFPNDVLTVPPSPGQRTVWHGRDGG